MPDVLIVGKGPAAWSCAITAAIRGLSTLVVGIADSSALARAANIENYPGIKSESGPALLERMRQQALKLNVAEREGTVQKLMPAGNQWMALIDNDVETARCVVLCPGAGGSRALPGEEELVGSGVSYCATCDGRFYRDKSIAVLSDHPHGAEETAYLCTLVRHVDYYPLQPHDAKLDPDKVTLSREKPQSVSRSGQGVLLTADGTEHLYDGIFVFRRRQPLNTLISGLPHTDSGITVDRQMCTALPGCFAAGDCTGQPFQLAKAVGEGNIAALSAAKYLLKQG